MKTDWRRIWRDFEKWINEKTVGVVPWPIQKRQIQRLVTKHQSNKR